MAKSRRYNVLKAYRIEKTFFCGSSMCLMSVKQQLLVVTITVILLLV